MTGGAGEGSEVVGAVRRSTLQRLMRRTLAVFLTFAVLLAIAIPNLLGSTCRGGNETAAIATLRVLIGRQEEFAALGAVDLDGDRRGEFGFLQEMTAEEGVRADPSGVRRGQRLQSAVLSPSLAALSPTGCASKSGYSFRVLLPASEGGAVGEQGRVRYRRSDGGGCPGPPGSRPVRPAPPPPPREPPPSFTGPVDTDKAERAWFAGASPLAVRNSGVRAFLVTEQGEVYWCANEDGRFEGDATPDLGSLPRGWRWGFALPETFTGQDGTEWKRTR